jgi:hypothetical protein
MDLDDDDDDPITEARKCVAEAAASGDPELDLSYLDLTTLPEELFDLVGLETLLLGGNELRELPEAIGRLTSLTELHVFSNRLRSLPDAIGELAALTRLDLEDNELTALPEAIGRLTSLMDLDVSDNPLTALPSSIGRLTRLTSLSAACCELTTLPEEIGRLTSLGRLTLGANSLASLPETISGLTTLTRLDLAGNRLTGLPEGIGRLTALTALWLGGNRLIRLPESLSRFHGLEHLDLRGNPSLFSPPPEVADQGQAETLKFLRMCDGDPVYRWQSRILVVGDASAGKTSLIRRLRRKGFRPEERQTHGLRVSGLTVRHPRRPAVDMKLDLWDLGGRPEHRAANLSHLSDESLILLVWDLRAGFSDGGVAAWLETISARAPEAPILVVATRGEDNPLAEPPRDLVARYPRIVGTRVVDAQSGRGIRLLREDLARHAADLPLMGVRWPRAWAAAAGRVLDLPGPTATPAEIQAAIDKADRYEKPPYSVIIRTLLARGEISRVGCLPESSAGFAVWPGRLHERFAEVVDSPAIRAAGGVLSRAELGRLWRGRPEGGRSLLPRMLRTMEAFELAYRIGDPRDSADVAVVVDALPESRPAEVDRRWRELAERPGTREVGDVYRLASREVDVVRRFIARQHHVTTGLQWREGALLHDRDPDMPSWALIERDDLEHPSVTVRVVGTHPARFRSLLVEAFGTLVEERYAGSVSGPGPVQLGVEGEAVDPVDAARLATLDGVRIMAAQRAAHAAQCPALFSVRRVHFFPGLRRKLYVLSPWCEWPCGPHPLPRGVGERAVDELGQFRLREYLPYLSCLFKTLGLTASGAGTESAALSVKHTERFLERRSRWAPHWEHVDDLRAARGDEIAQLWPVLQKPGSGDVWDGLTPVSRPEDRRVVYLCPEHVAEFEHPYRSGGAAS